MFSQYFSNNGPYILKNKEEMVTFKTISYSFKINSSVLKLKNANKKIINKKK